MMKENQIDKILREADEECENENYHDRYGMAQNIFEGIRDFIPEKYLINVALAIKERII